jgi:hypothetical protein
MREHLLARGRARPHRAGMKGYISYPLKDQEDFSVVLEILDCNYGRCWSPITCRFYLPHSWSLYAKSGF